MGMILVYYGEGKSFPLCARRGLPVCSMSLDLAVPTGMAATLSEMTAASSGATALARSTAHCCTPVNDRDPHTSYPQKEIPSAKIVMLDNNYNDNNAMLPRKIKAFTFWICAATVSATVESKQSICCNCGHGVAGQV